jgi:membrane associated rhomboid family serine protease
VSIALVIFAATLVASLAGLYAKPQIIERSLFRPYWFLRRRQYETVVTSGFVHADLPHLIFNMVTFWFFAFPLERQIGPLRFALLYFLALVVSDLGTYFKHRSDPQYASLGASGAISAVLFAAIVYFPWMELFIIPIPLPIPAPLFAVGYVAYSWVARCSGCCSCC